MRTLRFFTVAALALATFGATPSPRAVKHPALYSKQLHRQACRAGARGATTPPTAPFGATVVTNGSTITTVQNRGTAVTRTSVCKP